MRRVMLLSAAALVASAMNVSVARAANDADVCIAGSEDGQKLRDEGHYLLARASFITCAHEECPAQIRGDCLHWLDDLDQRTPTVVLSARNHGKDETDVRVSIDGIPLVDRLDGRPIPLDPGEHHVNWMHAGDPPIIDIIVVGAGEKNRQLVARFGTEPPPPRRKGPPALGFILVGVGVVGVATFAYFGFAGLHQISECKDEGAACDKSSRQSNAVTDFIVGDSALVLGVTAGAIATWLFFKHRDVESPPPNVSVGVAPTSQGFSAGFSARF